jgi:hypothetical protein
VDCKPVMDALEDFWWISNDFDQKNLAVISGVGSSAKL